MTEKEKMLMGEIYNANYDEELIRERTETKDKCFVYNQLKPSELEKRMQLLKEIIGITKTHFFIEQPFICDYGYNIELGENFYSNHNLTILDPGKVVFGNNVFIGPNCGFYTAAHPIEKNTRNDGLEYAKPIHVGNDVWFGGNVVVLPGVTIGDNVVINNKGYIEKFQERYFEHIIIIIIRQN